MNGHSSRRILFSTTAGYGHIHPLIPLARSLAGAGRQVAFATSEWRRPMLEALGFDFFPVAVDFRSDPEYLEVRRQLDAMPLALEAEVLNYQRIWSGIAPRLRAPHLVEIARAWRPDMVIREAAEYGALIAAEHLGLPHATVAFTTALTGLSLFEHGAAGRLDPIREQWGLPPDPALASLYRYLHLAFAPPSFGLHPTGIPGSGSAVPPTTHFIRPDLFDNGASERVPGWVARLPERPTVYVTLGTEVNKEPELYPRVMEAIIAGLREAPLNLIVTLGRDKDPADFGPQPENVRIERYIPQSLLLPHCDLILMHAGSNSLLSALDAGLPMVVVPLIADQFFNASIIQRMELGQVVQLDELTPAGVRRAVEQVFANPAYRRNVAHLREEMHALPPLDHAVRLVEQVLAERAPLLNPRLPAAP